MDSSYRCANNVGQGNQFYFRVGRSRASMRSRHSCILAHHLQRRCINGVLVSAIAPCIALSSDVLSVARTRVTFVSAKVTKTICASTAVPDAVLPPPSLESCAFTHNTSGSLHCLRRLSGSAQGSSRQLLLRCSTLRHPCRSPVPVAARCVGHTSAASAWMRKSGLRLHSSSVRRKAQKFLKHPKKEAALRQCG